MSSRARTPIVVDSATIRRLPLPVVEYLTVCGRGEFPADPVRHYEHVVRCVGRLTSAVEVIYRRDGAGAAVLGQALAAQRLETQRLSADPAGSLQTPPVKDAMESLSYLLAQLREFRFRPVEGLSREVAQTRRAARALRADRPLVGQDSVVGEFFNRAGNAVLLMSGAAIESTAGAAEDTLTR